jgi:hypothetical protein
LDKLCHAKFVGWLHYVKVRTPCLQNIYRVVRSASIDDIERFHTDHSVAVEKSVDVSTAVARRNKKSPTAHSISTTAQRINSRSAASCNLTNFSEAFLLKVGVANGKYFVDDKNLQFQMRGKRKGFELSRPSYATGSARCSHLCSQSPSASTATGGHGASKSLINSSTCC